jgi:hypothetical protein
MLGIADAGTAMPLDNAAAILIARAFLKQVGYSSMAIWSSVAPQPT